MHSGASSVRKGNHVHVTANVGPDSRCSFEQQIMGSQSGQDEAAHLV